ncbi:MAG: PHP domain-containing protein [Clostridia bacterium]|nr:PHP domain-containing protein [Clostridia bacterium]MBO4428584.1 PHP domain-containing protein [Clostridia bacterium]
MKKYILSEGGEFRKINLHCHSKDCSDGRITLAELKDFYKSHGYAAVAFTDHNVLIDHSDLTDKDFIALTGTEIDVNCHTDPRGEERCYHINLIANRPDNTALVCFNPKYITMASGKQYLASQKYVGEPNFEREYNVECVNKIIAEANAHGFLTIYNHPRWSLQTWEDYHGLRGLWGMEINNGDCLRYCGRQDLNEDIYDWFLRHDITISPIGADDNHNIRPMGHPKFDSGLAWVMAKTEKLDYESIYKALESRNFYSSNGPEIYECYIEDGYIHVKTSPCEFIRINTNMRAVKTECGEKRGDPITECHFELPENAKYLRVTVVNFDGTSAWTNPVYNLYD